jgi:hypothetical protein
MPSLPGTCRRVGIGSAVLGFGLAAHGFVRLYNIQVAATAEMCNLEISSGALLMMLGGLFLAHKGSTPIPGVSKWGTERRVLLALTIAIMLIGGMVILARLR